MGEEKRKLVPADVAQVMLLERILDEVKENSAATKRMQEMFDRQTPKGIVEPLAPVTVTDAPVVLEPPYRLEGKFWFSVTIVKESATQVHVVVNTGEGTTPYTMSEDEKVYDQYFSTPCIRDVMLWTESGETCTVKVRGSR